MGSWFRRRRAAMYRGIRGFWVRALWFDKRDASEYYLLIF